MTKVLTFSLWGNIPKYMVGAIKNAELAKKFYPSFECWFYIHKETVPKDVVDNLSKLSNTKIIFKTGELLTSKPMCWRFEAIDDDDVEVMMARDTDTRIFLREKLAVDEWLKSDKVLHILRDHYFHHTHKIFAGMFGIKKIKSLNMMSIINTVNQNNQSRNYDLYVLNKLLEKIDKNSIMIHSPYNIFPNETVKDFPIHYSADNYNFVGCYIYEDDSRNEKHHTQLKEKYKNIR